MAEDTWKSDQEQTGANIKKRRNELHITQEQLAEDMSMTKQAISEYECGHRNMGIQMLYDFADAMDTTPDVLAPDRFKEKSSLYQEESIQQFVRLTDLVSKLEMDKKEAFFSAVEALAIGYSVESNKSG